MLSQQLSTWLHPSYVHYHCLHFAAFETRFRQADEEESLLTKKTLFSLFALSLDWKKLSSVTFRKQVVAAAAVNTAAATPSLQIKARGGWLLGAVRAGVLGWSWVDGKLQNESWRFCPLSDTFSQIRTHWTGRVYAWLAPPGWDLVANIVSSGS